jgi:SulP family sulfate permease
MAVIAAILVFAAVRMIEMHELRNMIRHDWMGMGIALIVFAITIYADPLIGILAGTVISLLIFVNKVSQGQYEVTLNDHKKGVIKRLTEEMDESVAQPHDTLVYSINGTLVYINSQAHIARFEGGTKGYSNVILRLRELHFIDRDGVDALDEIIDLIHEQGKRVLISSANDQVAKILARECEVYQQLKKQGLVFKSTEDALLFLKKK